MHNKYGFSLYELMMVIAICAIITSIATPAIINWRDKAKMKDAVSMLRADLEMAKITAIRENNFVVVTFSADSYSIFVDNGAGGVGAGNWSYDPGEKRLRNKQMPAGVSVDLGNTNFEGDQTTRFNGRGRLDEKGAVTLTSTNGTQRELNMNNRFGRIDIN
jgi:prepilin-type N-terminal cleavage/methylation domain-containing protein